MISPKTAPAVQNSFSAGFKDGIPIGLGYLSVSITFGMMAVAGGLPVWAAVAISMTNVTSAGQFAGLGLIMTGGSLFEMALTQLVINLRYALMSLSLSQKMERHVNIIDRMLFSFMMTDEVFAVASGQKDDVGKRYLFGLMIAPYCGWALGTLCGAVANEFLPQSIRSALGIAIYGMFIAILIPVAKQSKAVFCVVLLAVFASCALHYLPVFSGISSGFAIILCTLLAATVGALFAPVREEAIC
ncbi:MAG: AzlC family ABC transporter permease [Ruthenibacterium sp.]